MTLPVAKGGRVEHRCTQCPRTFYRTGHLNRHMRTHTGEKPYKCDHPGCEKEFSRSENLQRHSLSHSAGDMPFPCSVEDCAKAFSTQQRLDRHIALHERPKPFKCQFCDQSFAKKRVRGDHYAEAHEGYLPYKCTEHGCTEAFLRPSQLARHIRVFHTEKSYICIDDSCAHLPPFSKFSQLQRHLRRDHRHIPCHKCDKCGQLMRTGTGLARHLKTHELPLVDRLKFRCEFSGCDAAYTSRSNLGTHVRSKHTERDAFICETCHMTFSLRSSLKRHLCVVHAIFDGDNGGHDGSDDGVNMDDDRSSQTLTVLEGEVADSLEEFNGDELESNTSDDSCPAKKRQRM